MLDGLEGLVQVISEVLVCSVVACMGGDPIFLPVVCSTCKESQSVSDLVFIGGDSTRFEVEFHVGDPRLIRCGISMKPVRLGVFD